MKTLLTLFILAAQLVGAQTIADKLISINEAKVNIKSAIDAQGVDTTGVAFTDYHLSIAEIEGGGGEVGGADYERPADWLELPEVLETDQKMVALFAVHEAPNNIVAFTVSGDYTVDWGDGTVVDYDAGSIASHNYAYENLGAETWSDRGYRQAILTITPQDGQDITSFEFSVYPSSPIPTHPVYNFLDVVLSFPQCDEFSFGYGLFGTTNEDNVLKLLDSFEMKSSFLGVTSYINLFRGAALRRAVIKANEAVTHMSSMFAYCPSLTSVSLSGTSNARMSTMFRGCSSLTSVSLSGTSNVTNMSSMFQDCRSLASVPLFDTSSVTNMHYMFRGCHSLVSVPLFDTSSVTDKDFIFMDCFSLKRIQMPITRTVSLLNASMEYDALVETITSLVPGNYTLTIRNNPGAAAVMADIANDTITVPTGWTISN